MRMVQAKRDSKMRAKKVPVKTTIPMQFIEMKALSRDPKPMAGLLEFGKKGLKAGSFIWKERFFVIANMKFAWYPASAATNGFSESDLMGSIPIDNILSAEIDGEGLTLDLETAKTVYHFRSTMQGEVKVWMENIMKTSPYGAEKFKDQNMVFVKGGRQSIKRGLPFGLNYDLLGQSDRDLLSSLFDTISRQSPPFISKKMINDTDLSKWCLNRMSKDKELVKLMPSMQDCTDAIEEAMLDAHLEMGCEDDEDRCAIDLEAFGRAICKPGPPGSLLSAIIKNAFKQVKDDDVDAGAFEGEMSTFEKLHEYHSAMRSMLSICREAGGEVDDSSQQEISMTKLVAETYLQNILSEAQMLINRREEYIARQRGLEPSLRERTHKSAVDEVFNYESLPGDDWVRP